MIGVGAENSIDEVTQYQMGSYASSNEAIWRIFFSFPNHERHPTVVHLAVHLESGQKSLFYNTECITILRNAQNIILRINHQKNFNDGNNSRLYVSCSRVGIPTKLFLYAPEKKLSMYIIKH